MLRGREAKLRQIDARNREEGDEVKVRGLPKGRGNVRETVDN